MSVKQEQICRLCLKVTVNECNNVDETEKLTFLIILKLDLDLIIDPIICRDCMEVAKKCLAFKYTCTNTERVILSFSIAMKKAKLDMKDICKVGKDVEAVSDEDFNICRFCMTPLGRYHFVSLDVLMNDTVSEILSGYLPEMDFNIVKNPIICLTCRDNIQHYFKFIMTCQHLSHFFTESTLDYPHNYSQISLIRQESIPIGEIENVQPNGYSELMQVEEVDIKDERTIYIVDTNEKLLESMSGQHCARYSNKEIDKIGSINKRSLCTYEAKEKDRLKTHMLIHKDASEIQTFKCSLCTYETKRNNQLKAHMFIHKDVSEIEMFKCSLCSYKAKQKSQLNKHMLVHKDVSEIEMFKCSLCTHETKRKRQLRAHMLTHKDISEIETFNCSLCTYKAKQKSQLKRHMLVHKDVSEIEMFKCSLCTFEAKQKSGLTTHMLIHKDISEIKMFKCSLCTYEAKQRSQLNTHMIVHKDVSEIEMFKCALCTYEAKQKGRLKRHMLIHKDTSEIDMFKCSVCTYEAKEKDRLKRHMLIHKDLSEIEMFKCSLCTYEAKLKFQLKSHVFRIHKDVLEIKTFKSS